MEGPLPPDTVFYLAVRRKKFDAIICMYHDQGHIPSKLLDFEGGVSGWMTTGQVYTIAGSTAEHYTGQNSMAVNFNSALPASAGTVWTAPPAAAPRIPRLWAARRSRPRRCCRRL